MKGFIKMSKDKIPQYHPSYTEEENKAIHEYLEHATAESLAQSIQDFCEAYPGEVRERLLENLNQLRKELLQRLDMEKRYKKLLECRKQWKKYQYDLKRYLDAKKIRKSYQEYKEDTQKNTYGLGLFESFLDTHKELSEGYCDDTIRKMLITEKKGSGMKKPKCPKTYYCSIKEILINDETNKEIEGDILEILGKEELKKILTMLLSFTDYEGTENPADVILLFLTRKYSHTTHKKKINIKEQSLHNFSSIMSFSEANQNCNALLEELRILKVKTEELEEELKKQK